MGESARQIFENSSSLKDRLAKDSVFLKTVERAGAQFIKTFRSGGTIYSCGNGGSTCDAMHLTEELVARYHAERQGVRAQHFSDPGILTCWSNDYDYSSAFHRYAETFCTDRDVLVGISTSGNSENVVQAVKVARDNGCYTIALTGEGGGALKEEVDLCVAVPSRTTARIQEVHITIIHALCEQLESEILGT